MMVTGGSTSTTVSVTVTVTGGIDCAVIDWAVRVALSVILHTLLALLTLDMESVAPPLVTLTFRKGSVELRETE